MKSAARRHFADEGIKEIRVELPLGLGS